MDEAAGRAGRNAPAVLALLLLALLGYGFLFQRGGVPYSDHSDAIAYSLGVKETLHRSLGRDGRLPFWQESQMSGGPALTNPQALYLHPLHLLFWFVRPAAALGPSLWLHFAAAGLVLFALGRALGLSRAASLFMGAAGLFNFKLIAAAYAGWLPVLPSLVLSPLLLVMAISIARRPTLGRALWLAAAGALCLHSGHIQIVYYTGLLCACFLAARGVAWARAGETRHLARVTLCLLLGGALALGVSSYLFVPILSELKMIARSQADYGFFLSGHATTLRQLETFVYPEALGTPVNHTYPGEEMWEDVAYFGLLPLGLALLGTLRARWRAGARALILAFACSVLLAMDTPVQRTLWRFLPGIRLFHCPSRMLFVTSYAGIALAGFGIEWLLGMTGRPRARAAIALAAVAVVALEGGHYARRYLTMVPEEAAMPHPEYASLLAQDRSLFRVAPFGRATINYGWASSLGLQLVSGYEPYGLRHYGTYFDLLTGGHPRPETARRWIDLTGLARPDLLEALNVKYLVAHEPIRFPDDRFEPVAELPDQPVFNLYSGMSRRRLYVYRDRRALARAFFVNEVVGVTGEEEALREIEARPLAGVAVAELPEAGTIATPGAAGDAAAVTAFAEGEIDLSLECSARRFLVISEVWHPGWRAALDGASLPLHRTDYALLGAFIPPGSHRLHLSFRPVRWSLGLGITLVSLGAVLVLSIVALRRSRRPDLSPSPRPSARR